MREWSNVLPEGMAGRQRKNERIRSYRRALAAGATVAQIAKMRGCSTQLIYQELGRYRVAPLSPIEADFVDAELTLYQLSKAFGRQRTFIQRANRRIRARRAMAEVWVGR